MDLNGLLEVETMVYRCKSKPIASNNIIMSTVDVVNYLPDSIKPMSQFSLLFSVRNVLATAPAVYTKFIDTRFTFSSNQNVSGYSSDTTMYCQLMTHTTQTSGYFSVNMRFVLGNRVVYGGLDNLSIDVTYAMKVLIQHSTSTHTLYTLQLCKLDANGGIVSVLTTLGPFDIYGIRGNLVSTTIYYYRNDGFDGFIYEPDISVPCPNYSAFWEKHRIFGTTERHLDFSYYTVDNARKYLFPPSPIFDGSAYDHTLMLQQQIDDLMDEAESITSYLNTTIKNIIDDITDGIVNVSAFFDQTEGKITHWKDMVTNGEDALKTNFVRWMNNVVSKFKEGVS